MVEETYEGPGESFALRAKIFGAIERHLEEHAETTVIKTILGDYIRNMLGPDNDEFTYSVYVSGTAEEIRNLYSSELEENEQIIRKAIESGKVTLYHYLEDEPKELHAGFIIHCKGEKFVRFKKQSYGKGSEKIKVWKPLNETRVVGKDEDLGTANAKELSLEDLFG